MNIVKPTLLTSIFAILALVPCYFSFKGLWFFLNSDQATNSEGLIVMGIMTIPALILLVLYILSILKTLNKNKNYHSLRSFGRANARPFYGRYVYK